MVIVKIAVLYLAVINILTFALWGVDKARAKMKSWRIPEATLLLLAVLGGSVGAEAGMLGLITRQKWCIVQPCGGYQLYRVCKRSPSYALRLR